MIQCSRLWKEKLGCYQIPVRDRLQPESFIKITYELTDRNALDNALFSTSYTPVKSNNYQYLVSLDYEPKKMYGVGANEYTLDNSWADTDSASSLFIGSVVGSGFNVAEQSVFTIRFNDFLHIPVDGITIVWSELHNECATDFEVEYDDEGGQTYHYTITDNHNPRCNIEFYLADYNEIRIKVNKWSMPYSSVKLEHVYIGQVILLDKSNLFSFELRSSVDLLTFNLPDYGIKFLLNNIDAAWNPDNNDGYYRYITARQKLTLQYGFNIDNNIEWHKIGTYYMSNWTTPLNGINATFEAKCLIEFMNTAYIPSANEGTFTLKEVAESALILSNLPTNEDGTAKWILSNDLNNYTVTLPFDTNQTMNCGQVLQLAANAAHLVIRIDVDGNIIVEPLPEVDTDYSVDPFNSFKNGEYDIQKQLYSVTINGDKQIVNATGDDLKVDNILIRTTDNVNYADWVNGILDKRRLISGEFRADPRLEPYDIITNHNKYAINTLYVTDINYTYKGCFKGKYKGRVIKSVNQEIYEGNYYLNDFYLNQEA